MTEVRVFFGVSRFSEFLFCVRVFSLSGVFFFRLL